MEDDRLLALIFAREVEIDHILVSCQASTDCAYRGRRSGFLLLSYRCPDIRQLVTLANPFKNRIIVLIIRRIPSTSISIRKRTIVHDLSHFTRVAASASADSAWCIANLVVSDREQHDTRPDSQQQVRSIVYERQVYAVTRAQLRSWLTRLNIR